ncbi:tyrosine-type recombinase/integrase [Stackebrandtia soli]|uniref:tyrosine-type recombinase/integrase n=1 Tax=Stackebrandtia soli TaxID=1892856 RepID=UPI0039EB183D
MSKRSSKEGSIYHRGSAKDGRDLGWAAYAWVTRPDGTESRKYVYGPDRATCHAKWIKLHGEAAAGPVASKAPTVASYGTFWLNEIIKPYRAPGTFDNHERFCRLFIFPTLGQKKLSTLRPLMLQSWFNKIAATCQCCYRGTDEGRLVADRKCCARIPKACCEAVPSADTLHGIRTTFSALWNRAAKAGVVTGSNPMASVELGSIDRGSRSWWSTEEVNAFLQAARDGNDPAYVAYVLTLVLGLRRGEVLGLTWSCVDFDRGELRIERQLQRVRGELLHRKTKTPKSMSVLPLPDICVAALRHQMTRQAEWQQVAGTAWQASGFVVTTRLGTPVEPRNFNRSFHARIKEAGVRRIKVHDARRTCASILADLDVHPRVAMQILRHAKFSMTMEVYTEVSSKSTREALRKLGELLE